MHDNHDLLIRLDERIAHMQRDITEMKNQLRDMQKLSERLSILEASFSQHLSQHKQERRKTERLSAAPAGAVSTIINLLARLLGA